MVYDPREVDSTFLILWTSKTIFHQYAQSYVFLKLHGSSIDKIEVMLIYYRQIDMISVRLCVA